MKYAEIIVEYMNEHSLSQQKLANMIGVNQTTVSQWLLGKKKPGYDNIKAIYDKLGIQPNDLFDL